jgi:hypothetical protein
MRKRDHRNLLEPVLARRSADFVRIRTGHRNDYQFPNTVCSESDGIHLLFSWSLVRLSHFSTLALSLLVPFVTDTDKATINTESVECRVRRYNYRTLPTVSELWSSAFVLLLTFALLHTTGFNFLILVAMLVFPRFLSLSRALSLSLSLSLSLPVSVVRRELLPSAR